MISRRSFAPLVLVAALVAAGCGSEATAAQRTDRCLKKQPDAAESDCKKWEKDGQLNDDGTHEGHASMG